MSQRAKRPNRSEDGSVPVKRRKRPAAEEEDTSSMAWQPRSADLKSSSIYNRTTTEAPAELFRKDLISAMKLPDSEPLASNEYWVIVDQWKQEWERGVQVPVNPDSLPEPSVTTHATQTERKIQHEFKLPKTKYIRITKDDNFNPETHALSNAPAQSEAACSYDLDECDMSYLRIINAERARCALSPIHEDQLERVIEQLELCCWEKIQSILRNEEGLGIEYDENVICDVCRSPDSEEGNEMVFCDSCNICVHQACYGITRIPDGQWLCCTCNLSKRPKCVLCPNKGGAMKCTRSGQKWAHVSCALWIPEVSIGCVEKMEPITKISSIPQSRWALICVLCRERVGACIQCSVKTCKTAYHVTCAFKHGLEMRAIIEDENADDGVKLRSYCEKHSKSSKKEKSVCSGSEDDDSKRKKRKDMTSEEKNQARAARLQEIEAEFHKHVAIKDVSMHLDVDSDALHHIYNYWKLKRKAGRNKPLLPPKSEDVDMLSHKREQADLEKMKMFVQLRQDLERVRNLCYMVSRREKLSRSFFRLREQTFHKQAAVLDSSNLATNVMEAVIEANHGPSIYDRLYSHEDVEEKDFDKVLLRIVGSDSGDEKLNGLKNPYKKVYFNGTSKRRSGSLTSSSDEKLLSSSEDDAKHKNNNKSDKKKSWSRSRLMQVERELGYSSDSDELMPIRTKNDAKQMSSIYSDSDSDVSATKGGSESSRLRTKAAVKEFSAKPSTSKSPPKKGKEVKRKDYAPPPTDLIVPQRQAAKKATENLKTGTMNRVQKEVVQEKEKEKEKEKEADSPKKKTKPSAKEIKKDIFDFDKDVEKPEGQEILAYVPQRQAAKKAAEHIKSGLGTKAIPAAVPAEEPKKESPVAEKKPIVPAKILSETKRKSSSNSSSSSSSTSSSSSSSSSSESEAEEEETKKAPVTTNKINSQQAPRSENVTAKRKEDWPFLDKVAKSSSSSIRRASSSSAAESGDDSSRSRAATPPPTPPKQPAKREERRRSTTSNRKSGSGSKRPGGGERLGDANVRPRNLSDSQRGDAKRGKGKQDEVATDKEGKATHKLQSPKADKKLNESKKEEPEATTINLEKEILERKAGKQGQSSKTKSTLDRLFGSPPEKKDERKVVNKPKIVKEKVKKENKEPISVKKSPVKTRNIDEVFTPKSVLNENENKNKIEVKEVTRIESPKNEEILTIKEDKPTILETEKKNRSIFSPPHIKDNLLDFDNLDDGFGISKDEEIMKGPLTFNFGNSSLFKEDSKEDSARETLNLVEKLRMELSKKSTSSCDVDDGASVSSKNDADRSEFSEQVVPSIEPKSEAKEEPVVNLEMRVEVTRNNHFEDRRHEEQQPQEEYSRYICEADVPLDKNIPIEQHHGMAGDQGQGDERWVPPSNSIDPPPYCDPPLLPQYSTPPPPPVAADLPRLLPDDKPSPSPLITATPLTNDAASMDCPYPDLHPQAKWADSEIMPNRRSSSSSGASTSSNDDLKLAPAPPLPHDIPAFLPPSSYPPPFTDAASQFVSPVSLFPPPLAFPAFPPPSFGAPFPPKPIENPVYTTAAFTSSQHNMELMVNLTKEEVPVEAAPPTVQPIGKKSPTKPTRASARVKSPKQQPLAAGRGRGGETRRNSVKANSGRGGRGRGRGRARAHYDLNTIHNKLVGTVYDLDFDDDISNEVDLKSLRERRKSSDLQKTENAASEPSGDFKPSPTPVELPLNEPVFAHVEPVLPGPVDMRTYSATYEQQYESNLMGFSEPQDEDFAKKVEEPHPPGNNIKVSLSDARNQLKVKIKGPIANYNPPPAVEQANVTNNVINNSTVGTGTSNLRRMRKKELLRQYWTQDMNMDDSACPPGVNSTPTLPPVNRTIITIPKAVASMTSIPTKDDYRDYRTDDVIEAKHRKEPKARPGALSRELRQLDLSLDEIERRRSVTGSNNLSLDASGLKRRGRPPRQNTPKIKIKFGNVVGKIDDKRLRPPKKRLANINMPTVEDLRRESMKFRKKVMADFGETKEKRKKKDKSEKRKRKKPKPEVQIISKESENPTKLIIRIGKKEEDPGPIKFKLSRCQEGSYVMKRAEGEAPPQTPPPEEGGGVAALPLKDCEVR